ncbi:MAG: C40 family peptidase [Deltaproteobacteria bacterium]|jgi:cell wall-associated NlpC family hydrolase|nr:C40 family peptidase [Deltaproteobacteria bacterium]
MPHPKANRLAHPLARLGLLLVLSVLLWPACLDQDLYAAQPKKNARSVRKVPAASKKKVSAKKKTQAKRQAKTISVKNQPTPKSFQLDSDFSPTSLESAQDQKSLDLALVTGGEPLELGQEQSEDRALINFSTVTKGLTGPLATGQAGSEFLAKYGRQGKRPSLNDGDSLAALDYDRAPRSKRYLRMGQGITNRILISAFSQSGRPFSSGGRNPMTGFDDAGLVSWLYAQEGLKVPGQAAALVAAGQAVARDDLRPGDVLVYQFPKESNYVVGVYSGHGNFILASKKHRGVTEAAAFDTEFGPYFVGGRRFLDDPKASPLSDEIKTEATNGAVKLALAELGDNLPKPTNIYGGKKSSKGKSYKKSKSSRRGYKSKSSMKKPVVRKQLKSKRR